MGWSKEFRRQRLDVYFFSEVVSHMLSKAAPNFSAVRAKRCKDLGWLALPAMRIVPE